MKFFHFVKNGEVHLGALIDGRMVDLTETVGTEEYASLDALLWSGEYENVSKTLRGKTEVAVSDPVEYAPVLIAPSKILCVGKNYAEHVREMKEPTGETPDIFCKLSNTLNSHNGVIFLPKTAEQYDYEAELTVIIGKPCRQADGKQASEAIFGYTCGMDFSVREIQKRQSQWILGKNFDGGCPIGPYAVASDEIDAGNLSISCRVNGEQRQHSNTGCMMHDPAELVSYISQYMTLLPGDCILTGTPSGVILGMPEEKRKWLRDGDVVEVDIENIGCLRNVLKAE